MTSDSKTTSDVIVKCENCERTYRIHLDKLPSGITSFPCRACGNLMFLPSVEKEKPSEKNGGKVLVAVEEKELGDLVRRILGVEGLESIVTGTGKEALDIVEERQADLLLVNVYLPDMMGYELLDRMSAIAPEKKIPSILLSSVHHAARYKRSPTSLYGADDYLERHHLPDLLVPKVLRLLSPGGAGPVPRVTPGDVPPPSDEQVLMRRDLETLEKARKYSEDPQMVEVKRICRVIVGDIALYNEDVIASTPPEGLLEAIASDLIEGEALLMGRFPEMQEELTHLLRGEMIRLLRSRGIQIPEI